mmetsp:Transcript_90632/g.252055  ORF Transcript_90632/g.252055 Transcript_90632/m.252055 type:complete len:221 (-) Transcript_90632:1196-1858(-)
MSLSVAGKFDGRLHEGHIFLGDGIHELLLKELPCSSQLRFQCLLGEVQPVAQVDGPAKLLDGQPAAVGLGRSLGRCQAQPGPVQHRRLRSADVRCSHASAVRFVEGLVDIVRIDRAHGHRAVQVVLGVRLGCGRRALQLLLRHAHLPRNLQRFQEGIEAMHAPSGALQAPACLHHLQGLQGLVQPQGRASPDFDLHRDELRVTGQVRLCGPAEGIEQVPE